MSSESCTDDFFACYFKYIGETEAPKIYNRWGIISTLGALLARNIYLPFGHGRIYPNQYIWFVGPPGARKGTALGPLKNIIDALKYRKLAPQRVSIEMLLAYMERMRFSDYKLEDELDIDSKPMDPIDELFIVSDEIADFLRGNTDFIKVITTLWDNLPFYEHPKLNSKSIAVHKPTVNFVGGITPEDIAKTMPPEAIGQGFFSRIILVYSEGIGRKITLPIPPKEEDFLCIIEKIQEIRKLNGEMHFTPEGYKLIDEIYNTYVGIDEANFLHYNSRRFTHLIKLSMIFAAVDLTYEITETHIRKAHTLLYYTEKRMPKALGEFGRSRNSAIGHGIIEILKSKGSPQTVQDIWKLVHNDLPKQQDLIDLLQGLQYAEKIMIADGVDPVTKKPKRGFITKRIKEVVIIKSHLWDEEGFLYSEERM